MPGPQGITRMPGITTTRRPTVTATSRARTALLLLACLLPAFAWAQAGYPSRPVKGINPFAPGGPSDVMGRLIGDRLARKLGQPFVMENRSGAGGNVGLDALAKSAPDGYTLAWVVDFPLTVNPVLYPKMPYDVEKDIVPVTIFATGEVALVVHPSVKANNMAELIALAKTQPLAFASGGNGSPGHMIGELFKRELNLPQMTHVPYKGNAQATQSILSGETQVFFGALPGTLAHVQAGKLRPLALMGRERSTHLPSLPTSAELGYPKLLASNWFGVVMPAGTPRAITEMLHTEIAAITRERDFIERLDKMGLSATSIGPEQMRAMMRSEKATWAQVVRGANIKVE
jgi:tripartite-type tricarboxylate transporter receptor subunit TctC